MRDPLVSDPVSLTCGPHLDEDPLTVDLVNSDQVNADVMMMLAEANAVLTSC